MLAAEDLRAATLFSRLSAPEVDALIPILRVQDLPKGTSLFREGEPMDRLYLVISGWVTLFRDTSAGQRVVIRVFGPGETLAEAALFLDSMFPVSGEVAENARLASLDRRAFERLLTTSPRVATGMIASLAMHLRALTIEIEQLKTRTATERVAAFLLTCCPDRGQADCSFELPYDKSLIAQRLGMQPESLSRNLARLRSHGISVDRNRVIVGSPGALEQALRSGDLGRSFAG